MLTAFPVAFKDYLEECKTGFHSVLSLGRKAWTQFSHLVLFFGVQLN